MFQKFKIETKWKKHLLQERNKGIGFGTAKLLLQNGYYVYITSRNLQNGVNAVEKLKAEGLSNVEVIQMDVKDESSVQKCLEDIWERTDVLDVLINNAGINGGNNPYTALEAKPEEFQAAFDTNVIGTARVTNAFIDLLRKSTKPRIVNLSTSVGSLALQSDPSWPAYNMPKMQSMLLQKQH